MSASADLRARAWLALCSSVRGAVSSHRGSPSLSGIDPALFVRLADEHGVAPLLAATGGPELPGSVRTELDRRAEATATVSLAQLARVDRLLRAFGDARIDAAVIKGPTLSMLAFGDPARRPSVDIDLMVERAMVPAAVEALRGAGYHAPELDQLDLRQLLRVGREIGFVKGDEIVEVQWAFAPPNDAVRLDPCMLRIETIAIGGIDIPTFAPSDLLVALAIHAARERWWRLLWLADIAGLIRREVDWDRVAELAETGKVARVVKITLLLTQRVLGVGAPPYLRRWLSEDARAARWVDLIIARQGATNAAVTSGTLVGLHDDAIADVGATLRWLLVPTSEDLRAVPLPDALSPAYAFLRPLRLLSRRVRSRAT